MQESAKIVIVGAGPAGVAVAASLVAREPGLKDDILILEKARHPRPKLCGGGITPWADDMLDTLGLQVDVPTFHVKRVAFYLGKGQRPFHFVQPRMLRTVRRDEFDAALVQRIRQLGIRVLEQEPVRDLAIEAGGVTVTTEHGSVRCEILIGADGAKSFVKRQLFRETRSRISRLMEVLVPVDPAQTPEFSQNMAVFDFRDVGDGLQGYLWDFPSYIGGKAYLNTGVFDSRIIDGPRANLPELLQRRLAARDIDAADVELMGHPERWYHPNGLHSRPRVLLVGDAAGIEPWLGEGISIALGYGPVAADTVCSALASGDYSFADYPRRIAHSKLGWFLKRNRIIASYFYRPAFARLLPFFGRILAWHMNRKKPAVIDPSPQKQALNFIFF